VGFHGYYYALDGGAAWIRRCWFGIGGRRRTDISPHNLVASLRNGSERDRQEAERWSNHSTEESKRWRDAYGDLSLISPSASPVPGWRDDEWNETVDLERCKRYVNDQGSLDSAGECFLHAYALGVIGARHYVVFPY
jgi:hypothetical protein